ncbi:hypothetical protein [Hymenobacter metallicola]|nr:hypothetical protein [Hymenobacter metallicola]
MKNINWPRVLIGLLFLLLLAALAKNLVGGLNRRKQLRTTTQSR